MPYFRVMVHGGGIDVPGTEGTDSVIGFYTTRVVRAGSPDRAAERAKDVVAREWGKEPYKSSNRGLPPQLTVESVTKTTLLESLTFRNSGYSLYSSDKPEK
jgi:hypothetical protein